MLSTVHSAALQGIEAVPVLVEVNSGESGDPRLILVGLPDAAVKESDDRVFSALSNSGYRKPRTRTTINLAPGDLKKEGPMYDLPIAIGILASTNQLPNNAKLNEFLIGGELSLSGSTRAIRGGLAFAMAAKRLGKRGVILPIHSAQEASLVSGIEAYGVESLDQAKRFLSGEIILSPLEAPASNGSADYSQNHLDFSDVKGQETVKRAVEIAVSGNHNLLIIGPPGSGKSMIAKRIPNIMPEPTLDEFLEILQIQSAAGITKQNANLERCRPYRSPHHTISDVGLLGGGSIPGPGEISLAHNGVLFLDELPEYKRSALEVLRQPLEDAQVTISRSAGKVTLPCNFMLVAALNPCPCGYLGSNQQECVCSPIQVQRYRNRISGPLLDRIDIHVEAPALSLEQLRNKEKGESSKDIKARIITARERQSVRFQGSSTNANADMNHQEIERICSLDDQMGTVLQKAMEKLRLSARAYDRIRKVARTIADLDSSEEIQLTHLMEAIQYRSLDRSEQ
ncbi:YifB family Mg chelatase-like AAA ATPase [Puniceicoccaceae bacterium K14]|nr:YifB family Mg chelatase-like AAA ATPase [Puniceicoccaceae bacterium K14]